MDAASFAFIGVSPDFLCILSNQATSSPTVDLVDSSGGLELLFFSRYRL